MILAKPGQHIRHLVVVADRGSAAAEPFQDPFVITQHFFHIFRIDPADLLFLNRNPGADQGFLISPVAAQALPVIILKDAADPPVSQVDQMLCRHAARRLIIQGNMRNIAIRIICIEKKDGDSSLPELPVIKQIRIRKAARYRFHNQRIPAAAPEKVSQNILFRLPAVAGEYNSGRISRLLQNPGHRLENAGKNIAVRIGTDNRHRP